MSKDEKQKQRYRRGQSPHPGVTVRKRGDRTALHPSGRSYPVYQALWTDPDLGKRCTQMLHQVGCWTDEARKDWAKRKSEDIYKRKNELSAGAPRRTKTPVSTAVEKFLAHARLDKRPDSMAGYEAAMRRFETWAAASSVQFIETLKKKHLLDLRDWVTRLPRQRPQAGGGRGKKLKEKTPRSPHTVNGDLRVIRAALNFLVEHDLLPHLTGEQVGKGLKQLRGDDPDRTPHELEELQAIVKACLLHDAATYKETRDEHRGVGERGQTYRHDPVGAMVVFVMLTGCRVGEARRLPWERVHLAPPKGHPYIEIEAGTAKTRKFRRVNLSIAPLLHDLLIELREGAPSSDRYVFRGDREMSKDEATDIYQRLAARYDAPRFTWQKLRKTASTYLTNSKGIFGGASVFKAARQLGHSAEVAQTHYADDVFIDDDAAFLEQLMGIDELVRDVIKSIRARRASRSTEDADLQRADRDGVVRVAEARRRSIAGGA